MRLIIGWRLWTRPSEDLRCRRVSKAEAGSGSSRILYVRGTLGSCWQRYVSSIPAVIVGSFISSQWLKGNNFKKVRRVRKHMEKIGIANGIKVYGGMQLLSRWISMSGRADFSRAEAALLALWLSLERSFRHPERSISHGTLIKYRWSANMDNAPFLPSSPKVAGILSGGYQCSVQSVLRKVVSAEQRCSGACLVCAKYVIQIYKSKTVFSALHSYSLMPPIPWPERALATVGESLREIQ